MNGGVLDTSDAVKLITEDAVAHSATKIVPAGSIMVGIRVGVGKVAVNSVPMCTSQDVVSIIGIDENRWNKEYVSYAIQYKAPLLAAQAQGATITGITSKALKSLTIPVRSKNDQDHIVQSLNFLKSMLGLSESRLAKLDSLVKSRFVEMFGDPVDGGRWPRRKLGDVYSVKSSKRIYAREQTKDGVPFYRLADVNSLIDNGAANSGLYVSEDRYGELLASGQVPVTGDILVTARGTLGRCYVISPDDRFYFQDGMITWLSQTSESPLPVYLTSIFNDAHFIDELRSNCSGTTVRYLSIADLAKVTIPLPPLALQREFAAFAARVDKLRFMPLVTPPDNPSIDRTQAV